MEEQESFGRWHTRRTREGRFEIRRLARFPCRVSGLVQKDVVGAESSKGLSTTASPWLSDTRRGGFFRAGYADGGRPLAILQKSVSIGATANLTAVERALKGN